MGKTNMSFTLIVLVGGAGGAVAASAVRGVSIELSMRVQK